jgi:hypothetical protein
MGRMLPKVTFELTLKDKKTLTGQIISGYKYTPQCGNSKRSTQSH